MNDMRVSRPFKLTWQLAVIGEQVSRRLIVWERRKYWIDYVEIQKYFST